MLQSSPAAVLPQGIELTRDRLLTARQSGVCVSGTLGVDDVATGLAVQAAVTEALALEIGGWKCGLPVAERIIAAPVFCRDIRDAAEGVRMWSSDVGFEPELAFIIARDLKGGDFSRADVLACVGEVRLALELVGGRLPDPDTVPFPAMLADHLFNEGLVLGPRIDPDAMALIDHIVFEDSAGVQRLTARHPAEDPLRPLVWLANHLSKTDRPLTEGMAIVTGAFVPVRRQTVADTVTIRFGSLGEMTTEFAFDR